MAYNTTNLVNVSGSFAEIFGEMNTISDSFLIFAFILTIFFILFVSLKLYETKIALLTSSMIVSFISILSWGAGWLDFKYIFIPLILLFASLIWSALGE